MYVLAHCDDDLGPEELDLMRAGIAQSVMCWAPCPA